MRTTTDMPVCGEWAEEPPVTDAHPVRGERPEWTGMRLFGRGRQRGLFEAGAESHVRL